jgi:hypothetical protein
MLNAVKHLYRTVERRYNDAVEMLHCVQHDGSSALANPEEGLFTSGWANKKPTGAGPVGF